MTHLVAAVAHPGMGAFEFGVCVEVFALRRPELDVAWYDFALCVPDGSVTGVGGFSLASAHGLEVLERADTVVAIGWSPAQQAAPELVAAIRAAHARGSRVMSFCSGVFLLAQTGLLDGRRATTHWMYADELRRRHPAVAVDPAVLYIDEGDVLTSAGTAAAIDLCLHVVRSDHGTEVANAVARRMVVPPHRQGGQAQFVRAPLPRTGSAVHPLLEWMRAHLDQPMSLELLAARAYMSPRTFSRRFRDATGTSPAKWLLHQRLDLTRELLETSDQTLDRIAATVGFGSAVTLRHHFAAVLGTSPTAYRRAFRGTARLSA
jgi:AraC family transcriptional activator FtrA